MAYIRTKYDLEYGRPPPSDGGGRWVAAALALVAAAAFVSLVVVAVRKVRERLAEADRAAKLAAAETPALAIGDDSQRAVVTVADLPPPERLAVGDASQRPARVRNLLERLSEAERRRDVQMAAATIEQLRTLPGSPAADLDDALCKRLGELNLVRLFTLRDERWVTKAKVRRNAVAERIAREHGATLASTARLNPGKNLDRLSVGDEITVMNHPRFSLVVSRRARTAELSLNGLFFKRYDLTGEVAGAVGAYEIADSARALFARLALSLAGADRAELELLLPRGAKLYVSER